MSVTDRHSLTQNVEIFALCISQTAKQIDGFCTGQKEKEEPAAGAALHGLLHLQVISVPKNAAEIGYQQTRANRLDSLEIAIASAEKGESTRFSCSSFCAVDTSRSSSSSRVD